MFLIQKHTQDAVCPSGYRPYAGNVIRCRSHPVNMCLVDLVLLQHALCCLNNMHDWPSAAQCSLLLIYLLLASTALLTPTHTKALTSTSLLAHTCHLPDRVTATALLD